MGVTVQMRWVKGLLPVIDRAVYEPVRDSIACLVRAPRGGPPPAVRPWLHTTTPAPALMPSRADAEWVLLAFLPLPPRAFVLRGSTLFHSWLTPKRCGDTGLGCDVYRGTVLGAELLPDNSVVARDVYAFKGECIRDEPWETRRQRLERIAACVPSLQLEHSAPTQSRLLE